MYLRSVFLSIWGIPGLGQPRICLKNKRYLTINRAIAHGAGQRVTSSVCSTSTIQSVDHRLVNKKAGIKFKSKNSFHRANTIAPPKCRIMDRCLLEYVLSSFLRKAVAHYIRECSFGAPEKQISVGCTQLQERWNRTVKTCVQCFSVIVKNSTIKELHKYSFVREQRSIRSVR